MKRARFTEDQIIGVLKEHEAGAKTADLARRHGRLGSDALQLKGQVRRHGCLRGQTAEAARGRERQTEEAFGRADVGCRRASRASVKKMVGPAVQREGVAHLRATMGLSPGRQLPRAPTGGWSLRSAEEISPTECAYELGLAFCHSGLCRFSARTDPGFPLRSDPA
jgi:hypothetical protein